ncbi:MAG: glycosyl hydrolase-related protein, partial [Propioniciclava sp.]
LIVRLYEPHGRRASGTLQFARPVAAVREASLIEDPLGGAVVEGGDTVRVSLTPFEVRTYRVAL